MRVLKVIGGQMGSHMGRGQPMCDTQYLAGCKRGSHAGISTRALMLVLSSIICLLANCAMAINKPGAPATLAHSSAIVWHSAATLAHYSVEQGNEQGHSCSVANSGTVTSLRAIPRRCEPNSAAPVLINPSSPSFCKRVLLYPAMRGERLRMCSRRGGSRGRATTQRPAPISPSSSVEVTSEQQHLHGNRAGRGRGLGSERIIDCGHEAHPTVRDQADATLENPPQVQGTVPIIDLQRPVRESSPLATPAALAGPSEPVQGLPSSAVVPLSDSDDSLQFGCRVEEAPYTTDDE